MTRGDQERGTMTDVRIDDRGCERCWNCGGFHFRQQRKTPSKVTFGVGALVTTRRRCLGCGEYNDLGSAKAYDGPWCQEYRGEWEREQARRCAADATSSRLPLRLGQLAHPGPEVLQTLDVE